MKKIKFRTSVLSMNWHIERVTHMLAGKFNITPETVGDQYPDYMKRALMARFQK